MTPHAPRTDNPLTSLSELQSSHHTSPAVPRRRPTPEQGHALETLGHAVEYLIDEGLLCGDTIDLNITAAVHLLSQASRSVYLECDPVPRSAPARAQNRRLAPSTHIRWKWMPSPPFMLPMFRDPAAPYPSRNRQLGNAPEEV